MMGGRWETGCFCCEGGEGFAHVVRRGEGCCIHDGGIQWGCCSHGAGSQVGLGWGGQAAMLCVQWGRAGQPACGGVLGGGAYLPLWYSAPRSVTPELCSFCICDPHGMWSLTAQKLDSPELNKHFCRIVCIGMSFLAEVKLNDLVRPLPGPLFYDSVFSNGSTRNRPHFYSTVVLL